MSMLLLPVVRFSPADVPSECCWTRCVSEASIGADEGVRVTRRVTSASIGADEDVG